MMERPAFRSKNSPPAGATSALRGAKKQLQLVETKAQRLKRGAVLSVPRVCACARAALTNTKSAPQLFDKLNYVVGQRPQGDQATRGNKPQLCVEDSRAAAADQHLRETRAAHGRL